MGDHVLSTWLVFFIVSIAASRLGVLFPKIGLPLITGYLVVGALAGPFVLNVIQAPDIPRLSYVTQFALAFIAFSAGAELYLPELRSLFKRILYMTTSIAVVTFIVCTLMILALAQGGLVPFMADLDPWCRLSVASIAASIMVARSPASAIAVVKEMKAKGIFTSTLLGVTVLCDVYVLLGFTLTTTIAESECKGEGFSAAALGIMLATMLGSLVFGYVLGKFLVFLMMFKRIPARYLILPLGLAVFVVSNFITEYTHEHLEYVLNFEPLLMCIMAGYVCTNTSKHRHRFIQVLQQAGPYVFLPFFTLTGASLDLRVLVQSFGFAAIVALIRAATIFMGSASGGYLSGQPAQHNMYMWMTLLTQAGVSLGLASEVGMAFPGWGRAFQTSIISVVLVNQIVGPILFKIAIRRVGEAGKGASGDAFDADAVQPSALICGHSQASLATAVRLLHARWRVTLVTANETQALDAEQAIRTYGEETRAAADAARGTMQKVVSAVVATPVRTAQRGWWALLSGRFAGAQEIKDDAPATATAAADTAAPAHHEEEHEAAPALEASFSACALLDDSTPAHENPFMSDAALQGAGEEGSIEASGATSARARGAGVGFQFAKLVALVHNTRTLQAVAIMLDTDAACIAAATVIEATISGARKTSHLHSVRIVARVQDTRNGDVLEGMGVIPLHAHTVHSLVASKLLTFPLNKPVTLFPALPSNDETARVMRAAMEGPPLWKLYAHGRPPVPGAGSHNSGISVKGASAAAPRVHVDAVELRRQVRASAAHTHETTRAAAAGASDGGGMFGVSLAAEEVPVWERANYLDELDGMTDASAFEAAPVDARTQQRHDLEMFGSISSAAAEDAGTRDDDEA